MSIQQFFLERLKKRFIILKKIIAICNKNDTNNKFDLKKFYIKENYSVMLRIFVTCPQLRVEIRRCFLWKVI